MEGWEYLSLSHFMRALGANFRLISLLENILTDEITLEKCYTNLFWLSMDYMNMYRTTAITLYPDNLPTIASS